MRSPLTFAIILVGAGAAVAAESSMVAGNRISAPPGFHQFCSNSPSGCRAVGPALASIKLTAPRLAELVEVNANVNRSTRETKDLKLFGQEDVWSYPINGRGDCEDYVLAKRRDLIAHGWPSSVLLVTVVRDEVLQGHAVLTVVTNSGDYVLDNRTDAIRPWSQTPYTYYARQSPDDPRQWTTISVASSQSNQAADLLGSKLPPATPSISAKNQADRADSGSPANSGGVSAARDDGENSGARNTGVSSGGGNANSSNGNAAASANGGNANSNNGNTSASSNGGNANSNNGNTAASGNGGNSGGYPNEHANR